MYSQVLRMGYYLEGRHQEHGCTSFSAKDSDYYMPTKMQPTHMLVLPSVKISG